MNRIPPQQLTGTVKRYDPQSGRGVITCPTTRYDPIIDCAGLSLTVGDTVQYTIERQGLRWRASIITTRSV
jgi:cold shock CspA family protein